MKNYIAEDMTGGNGVRVRYKFTEKTKKGETLIFDLIRCTNPGGARSLPERWKAAGYIDRVLQSWIGVDTFATDSAGNCRRAYDPTVDETGKHINFEWMIEDTPANRARMIAEICRRAFN